MKQLTKTPSFARPLTFSAAFFNAKWAAISNAPAPGIKAPQILSF
jgi:hypothetical protein